MPKRQTTLLPWITILDSPPSSSNDNSDDESDDDNDGQQQPQQALPVISANSSGRAPPPLPVELLSIISKLAANRRALSETCWLFHDICLPLLFESVDISGGRDLNRLLSISQKTHLASLVRDLRVSFPDYFAYPSSFPDAMNLISTSIVQLCHLTTFTLEDSPESVYLTYGLQLAILTHPTLRELSFDRWYSTQNNLRPSFQRDRDQTLVLPLVSYPQPLHLQAHDILPMDSFIDRLGSYLVHFNAVVRVLSLRVGPHAGPIDGHPLNILLSTLPGLETLQLTFDGAGSFKDFLKMVEWFSLFLAVHSNITQIKFASAKNLDGDPGMEVHLRFPRDALSNVGGLDERVMIPELRDWFDATVFKELELGLRKQQDALGAWGLVGLSMRRHGFYDEPYELEPVVIEGLATRYPTLETLEIKGNFDSSSEISEYLVPLSTFATLHTLSFPTNYFDSDLAPSTCFHHAQQLEDQLRRARSRWEEEEQRHRTEFQEVVDDLRNEFLSDPNQTPDWTGWGDLERAMVQNDEGAFEDFKASCGYQDDEIDRWREVDIDPDDHLLTRLLTSGLLTSRPTPRDFVNKVKPDWIAIASSLPSLRRIQWTLHESSSEELGQVEWDVVRSLDGGVDLREDGRPDEDLEIAECMCDHRWDGGEIEEELRNLPPLFEQEANFKRAFTLDGFVGGASRS